jgi:hypothetical protein
MNGCTLALGGLLRCVRELGGEKHLDVKMGKYRECYSCVIGTYGKNSMHKATSPNLPLDSCSAQLYDNCSMPTDELLILP